MKIQFGRAARFLASIGVGTLCVGCLETPSGTRIVFDLSDVAPPCVQIFVEKTGLPQCVEGDDVTSYYYELWTVLDRSILVRLAVFTVQPLVKPNELIELELARTLLADGRMCRVDPGKSLDEHEADGTYDVLLSRLAQLSQFRAITSFSMIKYGGANQLAVDYYVGHHELHATPWNGKFYGVVNGLNPFAWDVAIENGGAVIDTDVVVGEFSSLFLTVESLPPDREGGVPSDHVVMAGSAGYGYRGVIRAEARSRVSSARGTFSLRPID